MRHQISPLIPLYFLGCAPSHALNIAPFHLPEVDAGIKRIADIVKYIGAQDRVAPRQRVEQNLRDRHPECKVMERFAKSLLLIPADVRRFVETGGAEADLTQMQQR